MISTFCSKFSCLKRYCFNSKSLQQKLRFQYSSLLPKKQLPIIQNQLKQVLDSQIKQQEKNLYDLAHFQKLLKFINWQVTKNNSRLQITKQTQTHKFHAFITIKPQIQITQSHKQSLIEQKQMYIEIIQEQLKKKRDINLKKQIQLTRKYLAENPYDENMVQITIFVQKLNINPKRYVCLQFLANSKHVQLQQMNIFTKIIPNRIDRIKQCHQYLGRGMNRINFEIAEMFSMNLEQDWELRKQVFQTMFQLSVCYEQLQYVNWLKMLIKSYEINFKQQ